MCVLFDDFLFQKGMVALLKFCSAVHAYTHTHTHVPENHKSGVTVSQNIFKWLIEPIEKELFWVEKTLLSFIKQKKVCPFVGKLL